MVGTRESFPTGTDFSDCPFTALQYALGRCSEFLVLDVPEDVGSMRVSEEYWLGQKAGRFMVWGKFDELISAVIPAKELRAQVRRAGIVTASDEYKSDILRRYIEERRESLAAAGPSPMGTQW